MKTLLIILPFLCLTTSAQPFKGYLKRNAVSLSCMVLAGGFDGFNEVLDFDYPAFKRAFPNANDQFWNPDISWQNKWQDGNPDLGRKFPGSTTIFVWTTDGYHLTRTLNKTCIMAGIAFKIGHKQKWWMYGVDFISHSIAYSIGFNLSLHVVFKHDW